MDEAAFRDLFEAQFGDVWRFARRRCWSGDQADDVAAETFAVAWRRREELPVGRAIRLWLFGTARLVLANQRRSDHRQERLGDRLASQPAPVGGGDPADQVVDSDDRLRVALDGLTHDDRDLLIMRAWDGLAVTEIAALLDCTPNAASIRLHKARGRLAAALGTTSIRERLEGDLR
jgi:RNA polymerase sigma-70 factor (ECF subfamily)